VVPKAPVPLPTPRPAPDGLEGSENAPTPPPLKPLLGALGADGVAGVLGWITIAPFDEPAAPAPGIEGAPDGVAVEPAPLTPKPPPTLELPLDAAPPADPIADPPALVVPVAFPAVPAVAPDETPVCAPAVRLSAAIPMPRSKSVEWIRCIIDLLWVRGRIAAHKLPVCKSRARGKFSPRKSMLGIAGGDSWQGLLSLGGDIVYRRLSPRTCSALHSGRSCCHDLGGRAFFATSA
jgi:hypothetical protein